MVFPISDDNSDRTTTPVVNYVLIAINVLVFVFAQGLGENEGFTLTWSMIPEEIRTGQGIDMPPQEQEDPHTGRVVIAPGIQRANIHVYLTLLTSIFMHGSIMHLAGN